MIQRFGPVSSQRSASRGPGLRHPRYTLDRDELRDASVVRLRNATLANMRWAIRRVCYAVRFRHGANVSLELLPKRFVRDWLVAYGCDEVLLDYAVEQALRQIAAIA